MAFHLSGRAKHVAKVDADQQAGFAVDEEITQMAIANAQQIARGADCRKTGDKLLAQGEKAFWAWAYCQQRLPQCMTKFNDIKL